MKRLELIAASAFTVAAIVLGFVALKPVSNSTGSMYTEQKTECWWCPTMASTGPRECPWCPSMYSLRGRARLGEYLPQPVASRSPAGTHCWPFCEQERVAYHIGSGVLSHTE